jgi:hypothetical protein
VIAGDGHLIARYLPDGLNAPVLITNTVRTRHRELFRRAGARALVPTTPVFDGQSFGTNVLEGVFVTLLRRRGRQPSPQAYLELLDELGWQPHLIPLHPPTGSP